jgi:hypothetical protein
MKAWLIAGICLGTAMLWGDEIPVRLHYLPDVPVVQTSRVHLERNDNFPGSSINGNGYQIIESVVTVQGDHSESPLLQLPIDLTYILKKIQIDLSANQVQAGFSPSDPHAALRKLIDFPLKMRFTSNLEVNLENKNLFPNLPAIDSLNPEIFFTEWFQHLFALSGKDLAEGSIYKVALPRENYPSIFQYIITSIDDHTIQADIHGLITAKKIKVPGQVSFDGTKNSNAEISLSAKIQGHASWNRQNALICHFDTESDYTGTLKIDDSTWNLVMNLKHQFSSCEKCISKSE